MTAPRYLDIVLDDTNSRRYRPRRIVRRAWIRQEAAEYMIDGHPERCLGPHVMVEDEGGHHHGVELEIFFRTHEAVPGLPDHYVKVARVRAIQLTGEMMLQTRVNGRIEREARVPPGSWIVQNPDGEQYDMPAEDFHRRYELDE